MVSALAWAVQSEDIPLALPAADAARKAVAGSAGAFFRWDGSPRHRRDWRCRREVKKDKTRQNKQSKQN